jgi:hypothetical protein
VAEITVEVDVGATPDELSSIEQAFRRAGFEARPEPVVAGRGVDVPWVVYVTLVGYYLKPFFDSFLSAAGDDAYAGVKQWVKDIRAARSGQGSISVRPPDGRGIVFEADIPEEALDALRNIDWSKTRSGDLHWSPRRREWVSIFDDPSAF